MESNEMWVQQQKRIKRIFVVIFLCLVTIIGIVSFSMVGVSQKKYDALNAEYNSVKTKYELSKASYDAQTKEYKDLLSEYDEYKVSMKPYESMEIAEETIKEAAAKEEKLELDIVELELRLAEEKAAIKEAEEEATLKAEE